MMIQGYNRIQTILTVRIFNMSYQPLISLTSIAGFMDLIMTLLRGFSD